MAGKQKSEGWAIPVDIKKAMRLGKTSGDEGTSKGVVHSRVCRFMSASFVTTRLETTGFGSSGTTGPRGFGREVVDCGVSGETGLIEAGSFSTSPTMKVCTRAVLWTEGNTPYLTPGPASAKDSPGLYIWCLPTFNPLTHIITLV